MKDLIFFDLVFISEVLRQSEYMRDIKTNRFVGFMIIVSL